MPFLIHCPCGKKLLVRDEYAGRRIRCPVCQAAQTAARGEELLVPEQPEIQAIIVEQADAVTIARLTLPEVVDLEAVRSTGNQLNRLAAAPGCRLVVSLGGVLAVSSAMIGRLLGLRKRLEESGGAMALCELGPAVGQIFDLLALRRVFAVYETEADAVVGLQPTAPTKRRKTLPAEGDG
jgi:anti-anti-sigma factor